MAAAREPFNVTGKTPASLQQQHSPWHSPVPYLFGGLAAMLGLIAFALLILACSYWKLSATLETSDHGEEGEEQDLETGESLKIRPVFEEKFLVIMAGDVKPTFLATPISSRSSSFGDSSKSSNGNEYGGQTGEKQGNEGEQSGRMETHENPDQNQ